MKVYVHSCGVAQKHGYCWVNENNEIVEAPNIVESIQHLIQSEAHSVVLARDSSQLLLLVTGIKASNRKDFRNRTIRVSVAWVVEDLQESQQKIRGIASALLLGELTKQIESTVIKGDKYGFKLKDFSVLLKLAENDEVTSEPLKEEQKNIKIATSSPEAKRVIADYLKKYCLPEGERALVVVTGIKSQSVLKEANVWRGLSTLEEDNNSSDGNDTLWRRIQHFLNPFQVIFVILLLISLALNGFLIQQQMIQNQEIDKVKSELENIQKQKQEMDKQIEELHRQSQEIENKIQALSVTLKTKDTPILPLKAFWRIASAKS